MSVSTTSATDRYERRFWIHSLILRTLALIFNIVAIVLIAVVTPNIDIYIFFICVAIWSLVEEILLICKRTNHHVINVVFDGLSALVLFSLGAIAVVGELLLKKPLALVAAILALVSAIFHIILFIRSCQQLRRESAEAKRGNWKPIESEKTIAYA
ncbi:hypothetical protein MW887_007567 [Aspergillus wentii]|nr:hypothetical protein MW887_007567 [Aspergillus wentii]